MAQGECLSGTQGAAHAYRPPPAGPAARQRGACSEGTRARARTSRAPRRSPALSAVFVRLMLRLLAGWLACSGE